MIGMAFRRLGLLILPILLVACGKVAQDTRNSLVTDFQAGKDFEVISNSEIIPQASPKKIVEVREFFSYGCPACYHFEPVLQKWLAEKPEYVKFERIPIIFQPAWQNLARAYYIAKMLGVEKKLTPAIFKAIHVEAQDLSDHKLLEAIFIKQGISPKEFRSMASFSPGINAQLLRSETLMQKDQILVAPTLVIDNQYKVDPSMVGGDPTRFLKVADFLIEKVRKGDN